MIRRFFQFILGTLGLAALASCGSPRVAPEAENPIATLIPPEIENRRPSETGCLSLMSRYCDSLYSPGSEGNLVIHKKKGNPIYVLQGKTKNGHHHVFYELARSKIRNRDRLPADFLSILRSHRYFERLDRLIHREPFEKWTVADRIRANDLEQEVKHIWALAISDTLILRLTNRFPEFPRIPVTLLPPEMGHFAKMERKILLSEISRAIWRDHPNWNKVTAAFEKLRKTYLHLIPSLPVADDIRKDWIERIETLGLVLPGSMPEIVDQDCSTTTMNAFYYSNLNVLTVCAGDFNSEDILITLAHEMAHALDHSRSLYLFNKNSAFSIELERFNREVCDHRSEAPDCTAWASFKARSGDLLAGLAAYSPQLPEFNRCLKKDSATHPLSGEEIRRFAAASIREKIRSLADEEAFIRITQPKLPLANGKKVHNPSNLNPCHYLQTQWGSEDLNGELSMLTAFTMEYRCSAERDPGERLLKSLEFTSRLFGELEERMITNEGEFSERKDLVDEGFSSPSSERFADAIGSLAVAEALLEIQSTWDRRMTYLAGNSWQCTGPSLSTEFPGETGILRRYLLDTHTDGIDRKKDLLPEPVRRALGCSKDFEWNECSLFNSSGKP
jgi:hypothetical protein